MCKYEIVKANLSSKKFSHIHFVSIQGAKQNLQIHKKSNDESYLYNAYLITFLGVDMPREHNTIFDSYLCDSTTPNYKS